MVYIGIDPGVSGGIAVVSAEGVLVSAHKMPETERDLLDVLGAANQGGARAALERVSASPQMGTVSAFTFGKGYGRLRMALVAARVPFDEVTPGRWQGAMGVRQKTGKTELGSTHVKDKNVSKRRAQELFPGAVVTHAIADALLIAEYARRVATGQMPAAPPPVPRRKTAKTELF